MDHYYLGLAIVNYVKQNMDNPIIRDFRSIYEILETADNTNATRNANCNRPWNQFICQQE